MTLFTMAYLNIIVSGARMPSLISPSASSASSTTSEIPSRLVTMKSSQQTKTTKEAYKVSYRLMVGHGIPIYPSLGYGTDSTIVRIHSMPISSPSWIFCENELT